MPSQGAHNDRRDVRNHSCELQEQGELPDEEAISAFREVAEQFDRVEIWLAVESVALSLKEAAPSYLYRVDGTRLQSLLAPLLRGNP